jgi:hypothetical protein
MFCLNNNDRDDTPNAPDSNGEGPDCSGLVFKSWAAAEGVLWPCCRGGPTRAPGSARCRKAKSRREVRS